MKHPRTAIPLGLGARLWWLRNVADTCYAGTWRGIYAIEPCTYALCRERAKLEALFAPRRGTR